MRERITHIIGPSAEGLRWLGTFHSVAAQILRRHAELVGLKSNYTILDTDDQERLIKQVLEAENIDTKRWSPKMLAGPDRPLEEPRLAPRPAAARPRPRPSPTARARRCTGSTRSACAS
jgi:superfamily I DNA/RNA helicase